MPSASAAIAAACKAARALHAPAGTVTLRRGNQSRVLDDVGIGRSEWESDLDQENYVVSDRRTTDFLIPVADYDVGNGAVEPDVSDEFDVDDGTTIKTYAVAQSDITEQPWRFESAHEQQYRVHTVLLREEMSN